MLFSVSGAEEQFAGLEEQQGIRSATTDTNGGFAIIGLTSAATNAAADQPDQGRSIAVAISLMRGGVNPLLTMRRIRVC